MEESDLNFSPTQYQDITTTLAAYQGEDYLDVRFYDNNGRTSSPARAEINIIPGPSIDNISSSDFRIYNPNPFPCYAIIDGNPTRAYIGGKSTLWASSYWPQSAGSYRSVWLVKAESYDLINSYGPHKTLDISQYTAVELSSGSGGGY